MKITTLPRPTGFKPIHFDIKVESQEELDAMSSIFNSRCVDEACRKAFGTSLPNGNVFDSAGGKSNASKLQASLKETAY